MKRIVLLIVAFCILNTIKAQIAYYDAIKLKDAALKVIDNENEKVYFQINDALLSILGNYCNNDFRDTIEKDNILKNFQDNPFVCITDTNKKEKHGMLSAPILTSPGKVQLSKTIMPKSIRGIDVTNFSQGLSQFMIERAKEELNVVFFEKFKGFLEKEENKEIKLIFPTTIETVSGLLAYQYPQMLPVLQAAFQKDMCNLPNGVINLLVEPDNFKEIEKYPQLLIVINLFNILNQMTNIAPPELLNSLPNVAFFENGEVNEITEIQNVYTTLKITKEISYSLRIDSSLKDNEFYWVKSEDFYQRILNDKITFKIYLGLLYQRIKDLKLNDKPIGEYIQAKNIKNETYWYRNFMTKVISQFEEINTTSKNIKVIISENGKPSLDEYYTYVSSSIGLMDFGLEVFKHYDLNFETGARYISIVKNGNELYCNIYKQNYSLAMNYALTLLDTLNNITSNKLINTDLMKGLYTYGRFIGNMSSAQSPEDIKNAISAIALPSGSSSIKKYSKFNVDIGSYLGIAYNFSIKDWKNSTSKTWNNPFSVTAPVGFNFSSSTKRNVSYSAFISIIDIGAIVDYQLTDTAKGNFEQKILLENILSPGIYFIRGFKNVPISFAIGAQFGPGLISLKNADKSKTLKEPKLRVNLTLTVDLPIINIYNTPRYKKK